MKSSSKIFGVIFAGCLMFATSGCLVMDPADEAEFDQHEWAEELFDDAAEWTEQAEGTGDQEFEVLDEDPDSGTWPDPFADEPPTQPDDGEGGN